MFTWYILIAIMLLLASASNTYESLWYWIEMYKSTIESTLFPQPWHNPTVLFTILKPQYKEIGKIYVVWKRRVTGFKAPKFWKGRSGSAAWLFPGFPKGKLLHPRQNS